MKKTAKIFSVALAFLMIFAFASTAFAVGESITHSGTSTTGYYTSQSVPQKSDTTLFCSKASSSGPMSVYAVEVTSGGGYIKISKPVSLKAYSECKMEKVPTKRTVKLRVYNTGSAVGVSTTSSGMWILRA